MVLSTVCRVLLLVLFGLLAALIHAESVLDPALTGRDPQDAVSGDPPNEGTTKEPFVVRMDPSYTLDYEDSTHSHVLDEVEGVLGPGAITAIVIAVFLGASVLLALIIITIRKFTAS